MNTPKPKSKYELINGMKVTVTEVTEERKSLDEPQVLRYVYCERPDSEAPGEKFKYRVPLATWSAVVRKEI